MRNKFSKAVLPFLVMLLATSLNAQQQEITLEEIWGGMFATQTIEEIHPMNNENSRLHFYRKMTDFVKEHLDEPKEATLEFKQ